MPGIQDVNKIAQQMAATGMLNPARNILGDDTDAPNSKRSAFEQAMAMMAIANRKDPQALLGMLAGQILNSGVNAFANDYLRRGKIHKGLEAASDEERAKLLEELKKSNPDQYRRELKKFGLAEPAETALNAPQQPAPSPQASGTDFMRTTTPEAQARLAAESAADLNQLAQGVLGRNNPLTEAADTRPVVDAPFQSPQGVAQSVAQGAGNEEDFWQKIWNTLQRR